MVFRTHRGVTVSSDVVRHEPPTVFKLVLYTSENTRDGGNRGPSGQFSKVLPVRASTSVQPPAGSHDMAAQSLYRDVCGSECNLLAHSMPLVKLVSVFGPLVVSLNFIRLCIYDLFRDGLPPDAKPLRGH